MLILKNLTTSIDQKQVLSDITLTLESGSFHVLMGPNGSGKSSLAQTILGNPLYTVTAGTIEWKGEDITALAPEERAQRGIFVSFQNPPAIPGVSVFSFLQEIYAASTKVPLPVVEFTQLIESLLAQVGLDPAFATRSLNEGFSGGEKKRFEMVQILLVRPELIILDEIDSGLDVDGICLLANAISKLRQEAPETIFLCITHQRNLIQSLTVDAVHIVQKGVVEVSGGLELLAEVEAEGYRHRTAPAPAFDWVG